MQEEDRVNGTHNTTKPGAAKILQLRVRTTIPERQQFRPSQAAGLILKGELPPNSDVNGHLCFKAGRNPIIPKGTHIRGRLTLLDCGERTYLGRDITIDGTADFSMTLLKKLPENLTIHCGLDVSDTLIQEFPASLQVDTLIQCNRPTAQMRRFMDEHERKKKGRKVATISRPRQ
jgi:hypothetical protein